jgi:alanyl-tRNA synthetase
MGFTKVGPGKYEVAKQKNIDFGGGCERILTVLNKLESVYETTLFQPLIKKIESISKKKYKGNEKAMRIIADHIKASVFIIADGMVYDPAEDREMSGEEYIKTFNKELIFKSIIVIDQERPNFLKNSRERY